MQVDPSLGDAPAAPRGRPEEDNKGHSQELYYPWDHDSLGVAEPLDGLSWNDLQIRVITVFKVQPKLASTHAKRIARSLGLVNDTVERTD